MIASYYQNLRKLFFLVKNVFVYFVKMSINEP